MKGALFKFFGAVLLSSVAFQAAAVAHPSDLSRWVGDYDTYAEEFCSTHVEVSGSTLIEEEIDSSRKNCSHAGKVWVYQCKDTVCTTAAGSGTLTLLLLDDGNYVASETLGNGVVRYRIKFHRRK